MAHVIRKETFTGMAKHPHGTRQKYYSGCRCLPCRAAAADYRKLCLDRQRAGTSDPVVPAFPVVNHLRKLSKQGVGYRCVCAVTGIHMSVLQRVKSGQHRFIKKSSAQKVLEVTADAVADHGKVRSDDTYRRVDRLLRHGFTYTTLSQRSGVARSVLSHRTAFVTAKTRMKIEKLYKRIFAGDEVKQDSIAA